MRGQRRATAALYPGKDSVLIVQEAGWAPGPVWTGAENLASTGIRSPDRPARSQYKRNVIVAKLFYFVLPINRDLYVLFKECEQKPNCNITSTAIGVCSTKACGCFCLATVWNCNVSHVEWHAAIRHRSSGELCWSVTVHLSHVLPEANRSVAVPWFGTRLHFSNIII